MMSDDFENMLLLYKGGGGVHIFTTQFQGLQKTL